MCCKRIKYNTYKGFIWRFIDDNDYSIKCKSKIIKIYNGTETIYNSVSEAAIKIIFLYLLFIIVYMVNLKLVEDMNGLKIVDIIILDLYLMSLNIVILIL